MKFLFISRGISSRAHKRLEDLVGKPAHATKVVYVTTPANIYPPNAPWLLEAEQELKEFGYQVERFDIENAYHNQIDSYTYFDAKDVIFISGGNTFYFMYWVQKTNFADIIRKFLERDGVYVGASAGVTCQIADLTPIAELDDPNKAPEKITSGMQLTNAVVIPHWGNPKYQDKLKTAAKYYQDRGIKVTPLRDGEALIVIDDDTELIR